MFNDTQQQLRRLEEALLAEEPAPQDPELLDEEQLDRLLEDQAPAKGGVIYQNFSNGYGRSLRNFASGYRAYNSDRADLELDDYSRQVQQGSSNNKGLVRLACCLGAGIVAVLVYLLVRYGGLL